MEPRVKLGNGGGREVTSVSRAALLEAMRQVAGELIAIALRPK
jgi:hypothetical protein